ncbi:unnamed protein product [Staurois parvus]|uniref:Uncharacterized protein n=1 Tax=Staurois parvus TaxID=386267 RepID=A0ABN9H8L2_9NEOB|nr:unnamed protein product [Staurois parvus]
MLLPGPNLPWATIPTPQCVLPARWSVMGPCTASSCAARIQSWHGSLYGHPLLLSPFFAQICHAMATFRSPHTAGGFHFCHRCCMASHCCWEPPPPHCGSTLWFWPRDCPNE